MWRSDLKTNPFPTRPHGARFFTIPTKTAHGVFNTPLNAVWHDVAPKILQSIKARGIKYSALKTVRFSTVQNGEETFGPVVVWIAVHPNTTDAGAVRDATPGILRILAEVHITDVVVEWYEGSVVRLVGPPLMNVKAHGNPLFGLNHPFNTGLGIPIARQSNDAQGTLTFLFKEMKTSSGEPSKRILAVTNKHVVSDDITTNYQFDEASPQHILVCGDQRFSRSIAEVKDAIDAVIDDVVVLNEQIKHLETSLDTPEADLTTLRRKKNTLLEAIENFAILQTFFNEITAKWEDPNSRRLGVVDWAPEISVRVDDRHFTRDIATIAVDEGKLQNFKHTNVIDLGIFNSVSPFVLIWFTDIQSTL